MPFASLCHHLLFEDRLSTGSDLSHPLTVSSFHTLAIGFPSASSYLPQGSGPSHLLSASFSVLWSLAQETHVMVDGICQSKESSGIQRQTHGLLILGTDSSFLSLPFLVSKLCVSMSPVCSSVSPHGSTLPHCPGHPAPGSW